MLPTSAFQIAHHYSKMQIETASKAKAVYMLHQRCLFFLIKAQDHSADSLRYRCKAQNILSQLQQSLKITDDVSRSLYFLYDYCYVCLDRNDPAALVNVLAIIGVLRDVFQILSRRP